MPNKRDAIHDKEMASRLKRDRDERETGRCLFCHRIVGIGRPGPDGNRVPHVLNCPGRAGK